MLKIIFLLTLALTNFVVSNECYYNRKCAYQLYSSKTPYDTVRGDIRDYAGLDGCEAVSIWTLNRHGNRNPGSSVTINMRDVSLLKDEIITSWEAGRSQLCAQDIDSLRKWTWNNTMDISAAFLTGIGYEELYDLAKRIRQKYPEIVKNAVDQAMYFRPTNEQRTITSAVAFAHGLTDDTYFNPVIEQPLSPDMVIRPYAFCNRYELEVRGDNSIGDQQIAAFQNTREYISVQTAVQSRLGISHQLTRDEVYHIYELCRFFRSWEQTKQSPWCSFFSEEDLVVLEYRDDIRHYYRNGYGSWMNILLGRPVIKDLYESFEAVVQGQGRKVVSYFSHDTMLQMAFSALGLFKDPFTLVGDKIEVNRRWRTSYIAAFSTNMIAVLNRCTQGPTTNSTYRVQIFINEKETPLCPLSGCTWEEFQEKFHPYTDASTDFCNLNYTGEIPPPNSAIMASTSILSFVLVCQLLLLSALVF